MRTHVTNKGNASVRSVLLVMTVLVVPGAVTVWFLRSTGSSNPYEDMLRKGAVKRGIDPEKVVKLNGLEIAIASDRASQSTWNAMEELRQDRNASFRHDVYGIATRAHKTSGQATAVAFIEHMQDDPDPGIRSRYGWELMLVGAPHWRTVCEQEQNSPDSETSRLAREALKRGSALGR